MEIVIVVKVDGECCFLRVENFGVVKDQRRQGNGSKLFLDALKWSLEQGCSVTSKIRCTNVPNAAIAFWTSMGGSRDNIAGDFVFESIGVAIQSVEARLSSSRCFSSSDTGTTSTTSGDTNAQGLVDNGNTLPTEDSAEAFSSPIGDIFGSTMIRIGWNQSKRRQFAGAFLKSMGKTLWSGAQVLVLNVLCIIVGFHITSKDSFIARGIKMEVHHEDKRLSKRTTKKMAYVHFDFSPADITSIAQVRNKVLHKEWMRFLSHDFDAMTEEKLSKAKLTFDWIANQPASHNATTLHKSAAAANKSLIVRGFGPKNLRRRQEKPAIPKKKVVPTNLPAPRPRRAAAEASSSECESSSDDDKENTTPEPNNPTEKNDMQNDLREMRDLVKMLQQEKEELRKFQEELKRKPVNESPPKKKKYRQEEEFLSPTPPAFRDEEQYYRLPPIPPAFRDNENYYRQRTENDLVARQENVFAQPAVILRHGGSNIMSRMHEIQREAALDEIARERMIANLNKEFEARNDHREMLFKRS